MKDELEKQQLVEQLTLLYSDLEKFVYTLTGNNHEKDDIVQSTMEKAWKNLEQLRENDKIKSWLFTIAKNETRKYYRKRNRQLKHLDDRTMEEAEEITEELSKDVADLFTQLESRADLFEAISSLGDNVAQIILLRYYYGMPLKEIADRLNRNYNTIRSLHKRGLEKLETILDKEKGGAL